MELLDNKVISIKLRDKSAQIILDDIEKSDVISRENGVTNVAVYWGLDEMTRLNQIMRFKKNLPSPIIRDYDWTGLYKPFDHQKTTAEFLSINKKAFCFNEAGTGKTSSVLWASDYLMKQNKIKKVLIICPLSIMYSAWQADVFNTCMHRTSVVCHGTKVKREKILQTDYDFYIINYDGVSIVQD